MKTPEPPLQLRTAKTSGGTVALQTLQYRGGSNCAALKYVFIAKK